MSSKGEVIAESAVRFTRLFQAVPEQVWTFLTASEKLPEWYGEGRIEPREGGAISLKAGHIRGVVTGWRPNAFLAYSWNVFSPGETISRWPISYLEFALSPEGNGTRLVLTHRPIPAEMQKQTAVGWHTMLDLIESGLRGEYPQSTDIFSRNAALYGVDIDKLKR
jgi:uncharacterized protein YndB with AHSA1/START domain